MLTALGFALSIGCVFADSNTGLPKKDTTKPADKITIPIILKKDKIPPKKYAPSLGITMTVSVTDSGMLLNFPFADGDYPITVELELLSEPYGFWTATFMDSSSCELEFDVTNGDYHMSVATSDASEYSSFFYLE